MLGALKDTGEIVGVVESETEVDPKEPWQLEAERERLLSVSLQRYDSIMIEALIQETQTNG